MSTKIILASASPRRKELLCALGIDFLCMPADIEENIEAFLHAPADAVEYLAREKAKAVAKDVSHDSLIIAADTIVYHGSEILGKPKNKDDAKRMLLALSDSTHEVYTGFSMIQGEKCCTSHERTKVTFRSLSEHEIDAYIETGEPLDKAGSYGIQEKGTLFVKKIDGDYFNVVGLPICKLFDLLSKEFDFNIL